MGGGRTALPHTAHGGQYTELPTCVGCQQTLDQACGAGTGCPRCLGFLCRRCAEDHLNAGTCRRQESPPRAGPPDAARTRGLSQSALRGSQVEHALAHQASLDEAWDQHQRALGLFPPGPLDLLQDPSTTRRVQGLLVQARTPGASSSSSSADLRPDRSRSRSREPPYLREALESLEALEASSSRSSSHLIPSAARVRELAARRRDRSRSRPRDLLEAALEAPREAREALEALDASSSRSSRSP